MFWQVLRLDRPARPASRLKPKAGAAAPTVELHGRGVANAVEKPYSEQVRAPSGLMVLPSRWRGPSRGKTRSCSCQGFDDFGEPPRAPRYSDAGGGGISGGSGGGGAAARVALPQFQQGQRVEVLLFSPAITFSLFFGPGKNHPSSFQQPSETHLLGMCMGESFV